MAESSGASESSLPLGIDLGPFLFAVAVMLPAALLTAPVAPAPVGFLIAVWFPVAFTGVSLLTLELFRDGETPDNVVFAAMAFGFLFASLYFESVYLLFALFPLTVCYGAAVLVRSYRSSVLRARRLSV